MKLPGDKLNRIKIIKSLKAQGMCVGQSDIFIAVPRHGFHGKFIELKEGKNKATQDQFDFIDDMVDQGYAAEVVTGFDAAKDSVMAYMEEK